MGWSRAGSVRFCTPVPAVVNEGRKAAWDGKYFKFVDKSSGISTEAALRWQAMGGFRHEVGRG